ncbi:SPOR domain-containing protein [Aquiflexum sp. LQ15W]|uniref:SPOR domain-containing protein n=1 Tax=Cognataquiflexum nitidum TaxID=2922272 RepID=UPI001F130A55|nr:SPOR domain-containing protein [Cognataquiflexum nitidum]MCH6198866.1 SPOR domain-containing protein [Cognataquiflexum nitidum]
MEKDSENNLSSADKDYGFPFVKAEPLHSDVPQEISKPSGDITEIATLQKEHLADQHSVATAIKFESAEIPERKKKSQVPLLFSLILLILIVLASMAYFLYYLPGQSEIVETPEITENKTEETQVQPEVEIEESAETLSDSIVSEVVETPSPVVTSPAIVGSTGGKLIVLTAREESSNYHLVVASLPNERIAREEAQVFLDKGKDIWLIFPSGDTRNYRLSVGKYSSFKSATDALAAAKADFNESTWILKY